ncbi:MAG: regulator of protease activity HflC (stomatin/prohibitin superfamily) [bacterium]|jgi:regulator of protease activity HflC (stomatin/prohibitin superfamily)
MLPFTIAFIIIGFIVFKTFIIVPQNENVVKERLGKYKGVLDPGFHFLIPFFDRVAYRHEMREQIFDIPPQSCITQDNIQIEIDGIVYLKIMDAEKASYGIGNYRIACIELAQTTMRSEVGKLSLDQMFSERDEVNENIVQEIDVASDPWGIKVLRYEVKNILPSANIIETLEQQMEADRQKRADITLATAAKESMINRSIGDRQESINISEGEKQKRINEAEGKAQSISLIADATAQGIQVIAEAIGQPGGEEAVQMKIVEQFVDEFGKILSTAKVSVVPSQLANIQGFFEGIGQVSGTMAEGSTTNIPRTK